MHVRTSYQFTEPLPERDYSDLRAVQDLHEREREVSGPTGSVEDNDDHDDHDADDEVIFGLRTIAMGDKNATAFAQCAHVQVLKEEGVMKEEQAISYRKPWLRGKVAQGVVIDDQAIAAITQKRRPRAGDAAAEARSLYQNTLVWQLAWRCAGLSLSTYYGGSSGYGQTSFCTSGTPSPSSATGTSSSSSKREMLSLSCGRFQVQ